MIPSLITLPNGQVTTTSILTVITPKPSQVFVPTTSLVEATGSSSPGSENGGNLGVIIGVVIGGFIGLCSMILAWWYVRYVMDRVRLALDKTSLILSQTTEEDDLRRDPSRTREADK